MKKPDKPPLTKEISIFNEKKEEDDFDNFINRIKSLKAKSSDSNISSGDSPFLKSYFPPRLNVEEVSINTIDDYDYDYLEISAPLGATGAPGPTGVSESVYNPDTDQVSDIHYCINSLKEVFMERTIRVEKLINKIFPAPQLTNDKFLSVIKEWDTIFTKIYDEIEALIRLPISHRKKYSLELSKRIGLLKEIYCQLEALEIELSLNLTEIDHDVLIEEMEEVVNSVKDYRRAIK